jgi:hydrogenase expression/formation protein HypE
MAIQMKNKDKILLDHGEGGAATSRLVNDLFLKHFSSQKILEDASILHVTPKIAFTTDSFVVQPLFFTGGDIGKLSITGTINDLAVMGAIPKYISVGFILEEGLEFDILGKIVISMAKTANDFGVSIITGDTKVVRKNDADKIFINTSGIGFLSDNINISSTSCKPDDLVLISGTIAEHGMTIIVERENFGLKGDFSSDCDSIADIAQLILKISPDTRCMRDPTRGGLATTLFEITKSSEVGIRIEENSIPIRTPVKTGCNLLGLDPLYIACEGRLIAFIPPDKAIEVLENLKKHPKGKNAAIIGKVVDKPKGLYLKLYSGGTRPLYPLEGFQFPRIC